MGRWEQHPRAFLFKSDFVVSCFGFNGKDWGGGKMVGKGGGINHHTSVENPMSTLVSDKYCGHI